MCKLCTLQRQPHQTTCYITFITRIYLELELLSWSNKIYIGSRSCVNCAPPRWRVLISAKSVLVSLVRGLWIIISVANKYLARVRFEAHRYAPPEFQSWRMLGFSSMGRVGLHGGAIQNKVHHQWGFWNVLQLKPILSCCFYKITLKLH